MAERIGPFRVVRRLPGGAREAFLGADGAGRPVVLEVLSAPERNQGLLESKIADEVTCYARLAHPNLAKVVDLFSADGRFVVALEQVDGSTLELLRDTLARMPAADADACWLYAVSCVFDGLAAAHGATDPAGRPTPVLHRNVSPSNVQVAWDGTVKLGNFDVANASTALRESNPAFTGVGITYLAPEQVTRGEAGPASDVYATMLVLWELLAGRRAIERGADSESKLFERIASARVMPLELVRPTLDRRVHEAVRIGLQPDPARRTLDAARARDVLRSVIDVDAARRCFVDAVERARSSHDAPTVAPPPSDEKLLVPTAAQLAPPSVPRIGAGAENESAAASAAPPAPSPARKPPLPPHPVPPAPVEVELEVSALESIHPPPEPVTEMPFDAVGAPPPRRKRVARIAAVAALAIGTCILLAAVGMRVQAHRASAAVAPRGNDVVSAAKVSVIPTATATASATATGSATASAPPPDIPADLGEIQPPAAARGHRIYVDGRVVGEGTPPVRVRCGQHTVRIGSAGRTQYVDVPCGQSIAVQR